VKKFDGLIASYLYQNKMVEVEGIGNFSLEKDFVVPLDADKSAFYPLEGIQFKYNTHAVTSAGLIDYIMQQTGKIRSLTMADFSSYVSEIKQFVNIGKPWVLDGIGTLQKTKQGDFELMPGGLVAERVNMKFSEANEDDYNEPAKRRRFMVGALLTLAIIAVLAGLGFGIYVLFIKTQNKTEVTSTVQQVDTIATFVPDTLARDSMPKPVVTNQGDLSRYKAIFEITKRRERAITRTAQLNQFGLQSGFDSSIIRDTLRYRLFVYKNVRLADSVKVKDSLSLYFGRRVSLERIP
jgi:disulfide bond formation protein DsbB